MLSSLRWFHEREFKHFDLMDPTFLSFLDDVRDAYGWPITLTSDARTLAENDAASGSSPTSRHLVGEAVDMKYPPTAEHTWKLVAAVLDVARHYNRAIELELVHSARDQHVHLAFRPLGTTSKIIVAGD